MRKLDRCKVLVHEFMSSSTFHGLPGVVTAPARWMRVTWLMLFSAALLFSTHQAGKFFTQFAKWPLETDIRVR